MFEPKRNASPSSTDSMTKSGQVKQERFSRRFSVAETSAVASAEASAFWSSSAGPFVFGHDFSTVPVHEHAPLGLMPKLRLSRPGDPCEEEADRVANAVMSSRQAAPDRAVAAYVRDATPRGMIRSHQVGIMREAALKVAPAAEAVESRAVLKVATEEAGKIAVEKGASRLLSALVSPVLILMLVDDLLEALKIDLQIFRSNEIGPEPNMGQFPLDEHEEHEFVPRTTEEERKKLTGGERERAESNARTLQQCEDLWNTYNKIRKGLDECVEGQTIENRVKLEKFRDLAREKGEYLKLQCDRYVLHGQDPSNPYPPNKIKGKTISHEKSLEKTESKIKDCENFIADIRGALTPLKQDERKSSPAGGVIPRMSRGTETPTAVPQAVHDVANQGGRPLHDGARQFFQGRFGADFSQVRVHTDTRAAEASASVAARAYTIGKHIVFGRGEYQPDSEQGRRLIAHELCHTLQQGRFV